MKRLVFFSISLLFCIQLQAQWSVFHSGKYHNLNLSTANKQVAIYRGVACEVQLDSKKNKELKLTSSNATIKQNSAGSYTITTNESAAIVQIYSVKKSKMKLLAEVSIPAVEVPVMTDLNLYGNEIQVGFNLSDFVNENYKVWFPNAFDDELIFKKNVDKKCDVGFCGSLLNRQYFIEKLKSYYNFIHDNFIIGDDMVTAINSYKIHWNRNLSNDINYRNFETIGCGIPLVTNYNYQYELLGFKHMENVMIYNNENEMFENINLLLSNELLREKISNNGYELSKKHTYLERCKKILKICSEI